MVVSCMSDWIVATLLSNKHLVLRLVFVVKSLCKLHKILKKPLETYFEHILQKLCLILSRKGKENIVYLPKYVFEERAHGSLDQRFLPSLGLLFHIPNGFEDAIFIDYFIKS